jgi:N-acetylneuraminic acid mutarotase
MHSLCAPAIQTPRHQGGSVTSPSSRSATLALALLVLWSCSESTSPNSSANAGTDPELATSFAAASNSWTSRAPGPLIAQSSAGTVTNSAGQPIVYLLAGHGEDNGSYFGPSFYNVATDEWTSNREPRIPPFNSNGVGRIKNKFYFSGGEERDFEGSTSFFNTLFVYDPKTNQLVTKQSMPKATSGGVSGVIDDKLYVLPGRCGPEDCDHADFRRLLRYNPAIDRWTNLSLAPHRHEFGGGGVIGGKFYVVGGSSSALDIFDPATASWTTRASLPTSGRTIGAVLGSRLFVIVGNTPGSLHAYTYDPASNSWQSRAAPQWNHDAVLRVVVGGQVRLVAVGGFQEAASSGAGYPAELYTP